MLYGREREHSLFVLIAWGREFLPRFTNSRCAGYILFLDTDMDNLTNLSAPKPGFLLVKSWKKLLVPVIL
ncbi:MAG: hypothetical protein DSZ23_03975 [Thermodesulfatator sp.]|nr:MAG: hypothetical protein DSZ23_03975 [Thermodesulfatator sp.]